MKSSTRRIVSELLFTCLTGCAGSSAVSLNTGGNPNSTLTVSLLAEAATPGRIGTSYVLPNDKLHSGDHMAFRFEVNRLAYVYLVWYSPNGWSPILFPQTADQQLTPGVSTRVPDDGKWIPLDSHPGEENIYVLASSRPLFKSDPALLQRLRIPIPGGTSDRGDPPPKESKESKSDPPRKDRREPKERGPEEVAVAEGHKLWTKAGKDGVALLRLNFQHVP